MAAKEKRSGAGGTGPKELLNAAIAGGNGRSLTFPAPRRQAARQNSRSAARYRGAPHSRRGAFAHGFAAQLLLQTVVAEAQFRRAGQAFLEAAEGLDQREIVERAAASLCRQLPSAKMADALDAAWADVERLFGWRNLSDLEPGGSA
jgi:hypothetical protein